MELPLPVQAPHGLGAIQDAFEKIDHHLPAAANPWRQRSTLNTELTWRKMCRVAMGRASSGGAIPGGSPGLATCRQPDTWRGRRLSAIPGCRQLRHSCCAVASRPDGSAIQAMPLSPCVSSMTPMPRLSTPSSRRWHPNQLGSDECRGANTASTCELKFPRAGWGRSAPSAPSRMPKLS